jgi:site-specific DNA-cytosine methylase
VGRVLDLTQGRCRDHNPGYAQGPKAAARIGLGAKRSSEVTQSLVKSIGGAGLTDNEIQAGFAVHVAATLNSGGDRDGGFRSEPGEHLVPFVKTVRSGARDENGNLPPEVWAEQEVAPTQNSFDGGGESRATTLVVGGGVRRITPVEAERLQGFPDDWTAVGNYGAVKRVANSHRYRQMGNAVAVPVVEWIMERIANEQTQQKGR